MQIVYSALRDAPSAQTLNNRLTQRLLGYHAACQKRRAEIAAIQKYLPGWQPPFEAAVSDRVSS